MAGPITLTRPQFLKTAAAAKPGASYKGYLSYIAKARGGLLHPDLPPGHTPAGAAADPYTGIIAGLPRPLTAAQITAQAQGQISPLVAAVTKTISGQTAAAQHAISGFTGDAAAKLAAIDFGAPYAQGEQGQAAVDAALRQSLAGAGSSDAAALAQRLGVINDPTVGAAAGALTANGAANGNTQLAQGSASLGNLIANAASASSYGQQQPGITRLAGLQAIAAAGQQGQAQIAAQAQALQAQLPSIIANLESRNDARSQALTAARENRLARGDAINAAGAKNAATVNAATTKAAGAVKVATIKANEQATKDSKPNASLSKTVGYIVDSNGQWIAGRDGKPQMIPGFTTDGHGNVVKIAKPPAGSGKGPGGSSLTANEVASLVQKWHDGKSGSITVKAPNPDANGNPVYRTKRTPEGQVGYQQAYKYLRTTGMGDTAARAALDTVYGRGDQGRAWLTNEEQATLKRSGRQTTVGFFQGHAFIGANQVAALRAHGRLPAGELVNGRYFIKPGR